jgi:hypothetical protein
MNWYLLLICFLSVLLFMLLSRIVIPYLIGLDDKKRDSINYKNIIDNERRKQKNC